MEIFTEADSLSRIVGILLAALLGYGGIWYTQHRNDKRDAWSVKMTKLEKCLDLNHKAQSGASKLVKRIYTYTARHNETDESLHQEIDEEFRATLDQYNEIGIVLSLYFSDEQTNIHLDEMKGVVRVLEDSLSGLINGYNKSLDQRKEYRDNLAEAMGDITHHIHKVAEIVKTH